MFGVQNQSKQVKEGPPKAIYPKKTAVKTPKMYLDEGIKHFEAKRYEQAEECYRKAV